MAYRGTIESCIEEVVRACRLYWHYGTSAVPPKCLHVSVANGVVERMCGRGDAVECHDLE